MIPFELKKIGGQFICPPFFCFLKKINISLHKKNGKEKS